MTEKWDKQSLKEYFCNLIDALDDGEYTIKGEFGWSYIEADIQKVKE